MTRVKQDYKVYFLFYKNTVFAAQTVLVFCYVGDWLVSPMHFMSHENGEHSVKKGVTVNEEPANNSSKSSDVSILTRMKNEYLLSHFSSASFDSSFKSKC